MYGEKHANKHKTKQILFFLFAKQNGIFPNLIFQNLFFQNFSKYKNKIFKQLLKHSVYDPLHKHGEISMFLTLSSKYGFI